MPFNNKHFKTALRDPVLKWIDTVKHVDILVGIPTYNNDETVGYVVSQVGEGLKKYYGDLKTAVFVADGGSVDDTREEIFKELIPEGIEKKVFIYRGLPGKGTSFRAVFECASRLNAKAVLVFDSDLRSIRPEWIQWMAEPILTKKAEYCTPYYMRHPLDGTITNMIVYPLTAAIFGKNIRQPIGGDFSLSRSLAKYYLSQDVWHTDVAKFGIDIWMTLTAVIENFRISQVTLGNKIHNPKDPASDLSIMFLQVISTLFFMMGNNVEKWRSDYHYSDVEIMSSCCPSNEMQEVSISLSKLRQEFEEGFNHFRPMYEHVLEPETFDELSGVISHLRKEDEFSLEAELWAKILYDFFYVYYLWKRNRRRLVDIITPLYFGRTGTFCSQVLNKSLDESEDIIREQVKTFVKNRDYLIRKFDGKTSIKDEPAF